MQQNRGPGVPAVKSASRTIQVLEYLGSGPRPAYDLKELVEATGIPRSSLYALLKTLKQTGWVRCDPSGTFYSIGIRALLAGTSYLDNDPYVRFARPELVGIQERFNETLHLARLDRADVVYLLTVESTEYLRAQHRVGRRLPAHATALGKAILAELDPDEVAGLFPERLTKLTDRTIDSRSALLTELDRVRARGYAIDEGENTPGLVCVAVALRYRSGPGDAISVSIPEARLGTSRTEDVARALAEAAPRIEAAAVHLDLPIPGAD